MSDKDTETRRCNRCGLAINIAEACAIARVFAIFYYCPPCYEIVANEE